jgi:hypothetical protein
MPNGLQLPFQATSQALGNASTITSNLKIRADQTVANDQNVE